MRCLRAVLAATMLVVIGCGESDSDEGAARDGSASSGDLTTTSAFDEPTQTEPPDDDAFVDAVDDARVRHGFTDSELVQIGEAVCGAAEEDSPGPIDTRPGTSHTSAELNRVYAGTSDKPFPMSQADAAEIGYLAADHLCPDLKAEVSHGADLMLGR